MGALEEIFPEKAPVVYASFWKRFVALLIDIGLFLLFTLILFVPYSILMRLIFHNSQTANNVINFTIGWLYFALQESGKDKATFGKKAMNIEVTDLEGNRITFWQATVRYFGKNLSLLFLGIGFFMMLWDDKKQTLHDKLAGTLVVIE